MPETVRQQIIKDMPLLLEAPKAGSSKASINTPINLGDRTQSTIDKQEAIRLSKSRAKKDYQFPRLKAPLGDKTNPIILSGKK